jgi:FAD binding domain/Berberine and berberine like
MNAAVEDVYSALRRSFSGDLLLSDSADYHAARRVWNGMVARKPGLIARCADVADIQSAVRAAHAAGVATAVRCGGHSLAGLSTCEGGMVIDLTRIREVRVDADKRRARFAGGCLLGDVDRATSSAGLVFPAGVVSETGAGGLVLGGGYGWLTRFIGLSCDNVEGFTLVAADGSIQHASASENPDLFWALRGGGGNFGIVTEFEVRLHPLKSLYFGTGMYLGDDISRVLEYWREFMPHSPDELKWSFSLRLAPDGKDVPAQLHGQQIASTAVTWVGDPDRGQPHVDSLLARFGATAVTKNVVLFVELQTMADEEFPAGHRYYTKSGYMKTLDDRSIRCMIDALATIPSPMSQIEVGYQGGAAARVGADETAFGDRSSPFIVNILSTWSNPADDAANIEWTRDLFAELRPSMTPGVYINFMSGDEDDRVMEAYRERWERLVSVKTHYDPTNFFRLNQNIQPRGNKDNS